jgi:hypothetical protein
MYLWAPNRPWVMPLCLWGVNENSVVLKTADIQDTQTAKGAFGSDAVADTVDLEE